MEKSLPQNIFESVDQNNMVHNLVLARKYGRSNMNVEYKSAVILKSTDLPDFKIISDLSCIFIMWICGDCYEGKRSRVCT